MKTDLDIIAEQCAEIDRRNGEEPLPPVRAEPMLENQMIVRETIHRLLHELQDRYPVTAEIPREEVFAWLDSRATHWFANVTGEAALPARKDA